VQNWWKTYARPDTSVLYVAGDVEPDAVFQWAQTHFGPWTATDKAPEIAIPKVAQLPETKIYLVDRKADQSQIRVGHAGIRRDDAHYETARILSEVFGGGFNSRLNDTIRVKKGLTYGARGGFEADRFAGRFTVGTFSKNATVGETVVTILEEIERIQTEAPSTAERSDAISYVVGSFPRRRETPQALVEETWTLHLEELPADYYDRYLARVRAVSSEAAVATAKDLIDPRHLVIVVVGPAKQLAPQLEQIAPVEIVPAFDNAQAKPASGSSSSSKK
jgi:zinc protease